MEAKLNTEYGTPSVQSWLLPFLVVLMRYGLWVFFPKLCYSVLSKLFSDFLFLCPIKKPGARVLYLGAASGTTVSHVSDVVGPVSFLVALRNMPYSFATFMVEFLLINNNLSFGRLEWFMQWNFPTEVVGTWLTWQRSGQMLFPSLKMPGTQQSTECWLAWWMWYFLMLRSLIRFFSLPFYTHANDIELVQFIKLMILFISG